MWQVIDITYTCLHYRHELSVTLSICIKSLFAMYFWRPSFKRPNSTSNWLCSKLLVTYPDRGGQANHFWHFLFLLSFLSQLSSAQQRGVSAKFYNNIFYSQWPPLTDKTRKKFHVSSSYTSAVRSTVNTDLSNFSSHATFFLNESLYKCYLLTKVWDNG